MKSDFSCERLFCLAWSLEKEEGSKAKAKVGSERRRGVRDQIKFIDLRFQRWQVVGLSELRWGKATVDYAKPQLRKKEESGRLRGERDKVKFCFNYINEH